MKKNVMMRVASALLVAVLMTTCAISGTFAKYTSTTTGTGSAKVAKWAFVVNGNPIADTFTFDLIDTLYEYDGVTAETDVKGTLLAPGTAGSFDIVLTNESEVTAKYELTLTETITGLPGTVAAADFPVEYSTDNAHWSTDITNAVASGVINYGNSATITVYWRWVFEGNDIIDTALGTAGNVQVTVAAKVILTQVD
jgi:hypothetical protein